MGHDDEQGELVSQLMRATFLRQLMRTKSIGRVSVPVMCVCVRACLHVYVWGDS